MNVRFCESFAYSGNIVYYTYQDLNMVSYLVSLERRDNVKYQDNVKNQEYQVNQKYKDNVKNQKYQNC